MLQARNVPLQDVNDVRDRAEAEAGQSDYARGVLDTLLWLNGDAGMPFGQEPKRYTQADREDAGPVPGTLTNYGYEDEDQLDILDDFNEGDEPEE